MVFSSIFAELLPPSPPPHTSPCTRSTLTRSLSVGGSRPQRHAPARCSRVLMHRVSVHSLSSMPGVHDFRSLLLSLSSARGVSVSLTRSFHACFVLPPLRTSARGCALDARTLSSEKGRSVLARRPVPCVSRESRHWPVGVEDTPFLIRKSVAHPLCKKEGYSNSNVFSLYFYQQRGYSSFSLQILKPDLIP